MRSRPVRTPPAAWAAIDALLKRITDPELRERLRVAITELEQATEMRAAAFHAHMDTFMEDVQARRKNSEAAAARLVEIPVAVLREVKYPRKGTTSAALPVMEAMAQEGATLRFLRKRANGTEVVGNGKVIRNGCIIRRVHGSTIRGALMKYDWIEPRIAPDDENWWEAQLSEHGKIALYGLQARLTTLV